MLISSINSKAFPETLIVITAADPEGGQLTTQKGDIVKIVTAETKTTIGYNFFNFKTVLPHLTGNGQVFLDKDQVAALNEALTKEGFEADLQVDTQPKFVVGQIMELAAHPDSDHLRVAKVAIGSEKPVQIVVGAPNAALNEKVVVALPGAMMPTGKIIWPGALRGVASYGMMCAARELALANAPQKRGILLLPESWETGSAFDFSAGEALVAAQNATNE